MKKLLIVALLTLPVCLFAQQLSGEYTIGTGGNYTSFNDAASALTNQGVSGPVTFNVLSGTYNEHFVIGYVDGASETNTIIFQSQSGDSSDVIIQYAADNSDSNYVVKLQNCSYITLQKMTFKALGGNQAAIAIRIENYAFNCNIKNNSLSGYYDINALKSEALIYTQSAQIKNLRIQNNHFIRGAYGVSFNCNYGDAYNENPEISYNTFDSLGYCAVWLSKANTLTISHNLISGGYYGLDLENISSASSVYNNILKDISDIGMYFNHCTASEEYQTYISNNFIAGNKDARKGMELNNSCTHMNIYNNSIQLLSDYYLSHVLYVRGNAGSGNNLRIINNNLITVNNGTAIYIENPDLVTQCDYNNYYSPGRFLAFWGKDCEDLRTLKKVSADNAHSISAYPYFVSENDLHARSAWLDGAGLDVGLMDDIDGEARNNPPDIGADEFTAAADVQPPLSGIRTIGIEYTSLNEAINDIQIKGLADSLVLKILPGTYNEQCIIPPIPGVSSAHPLIIESSSGNMDDVHIRWKANGQDDNYILYLKGVSFLKLRFLTLNTLDDNYCRIVKMDGLVDSLYIESCNLTGTLQGGGAWERSALIDGYNVNFHHQFIKNNKFKMGSYAIYINNYFDMAYPGKIFIENNRSEEVDYQSVYLSQVRFPVLIKNHLESHTYGLKIQQADVGLKMEKNYILAPLGEGIHLFQCQLNSDTYPLIDNNFVICDNANLSSMEIAYCDTLNICYNSVSGQINSASSHSLYIHNSHAIDLKDNIFCNKGTGYAIYVAASDFSEADYNCYYSQGQNLGYWDQVCTDLDAVRNASSANEHSIQANPVFAAEDDLHASSTYLEGAAVHIDGIEFDFDGDQRHPTAPDIGADEFYSGTQNPPYRIAQIGDQVFPEDCGTRTIVNDLNTIFKDDSSDYLTFSASSPEQHIAPVVNNNILSIIVTDNYNGENIPVYVNAVDLAYQAAHDTFLVTITPMPDKPIAIDDHVSILSGNSIDIYPLNNDSDPDGEKLTVLSVGTAQNGTVTIINDSTLNYNPQSGFLGSDSCQYIIRNSSQLYDTAYVFIEVTEIFSLADSNFYGVSNGGVLWGDFDNDKDLDLLVFGSINNQDENINAIYQNDGGIFTLKTYLGGAALVPDNPQGAAWGDVDNDGDLDLMIAGKVSGDPFTVETRLYVNNNGYFSLYQSGIFDSWATSITWVDYDNDGDQDVFITGNKSSDLYDPLTKLYRNDGKGENESWIFTDVTNEQFPDVCYGSSAWVDYDRDGDRDLLLCGAENNSTAMMDIFRNDNGVFSALGLSLTPLNFGKTVWADFDNDGDLDILFSGKSTDIFHPQCGIYRNDGGNSFTLLGLLGPSIGGDASWIDYDNDGDLDIAFCGCDSLAGKSFRLYNNNGYGDYSPVVVSIPGVTGGMAWGDYNNDGKVDLCYTGMDQSGQRNTVLMRNNSINTNQPPEAPTFAGHSSSYNSIGLIWHQPHDDHTPSQSLTYNIMVGELKGGYNIVSPNSHPDDGYRKIVFMGNVGSDTSYTIKGLISGKLYYFAVQAVDGAYAGSQFFTWGDAAYADNFMEMAHSLPDAAGKLASADMNKDKKMDLMMYGKIGEESYISRVFQKETVDFSETEYSARTASDGSVRWQDFDGDNDPDLLLTGFDSSEEDYYITKIAAFQNEQFEEMPNDIFGVFKGDACWGDYDNDGDEDVLIMGEHGSSTPVTKLYENKDSVFTEIETSIDGFSNGSVDWGDYDNDGDLDLLITGTISDDPYYSSKIYNNNKGVFTEAERELIPVKFGKGIWGDYDSDGDLDILLCGLSLVGGSWIPVTRIFNNNSGDFTVTEDSLIGLERGSIKWVDLDNDGYLDIIGNGLTNDSTGNNAYNFPTSICYLFKPNPPNGGYYKYLDTWLGAFYNGDIAVGDIDNDNDIDIIQCGFDENYEYKTRVFRNRAATTNYPPEAPRNLSVTKTDSSYIFSWDKASDDKTPLHGLTYNLRLGLAPASSDIKPCNSDTSGYHFVPVFGNVGHVTEWELKNPPQSGSIYWTVQTIDNNFIGSRFAREQQIEITAIKDLKEVIPGQFALNQNYPNPFNPSTTIQYQLAKNSMVELILYNILGEKVATLVKCRQKAGRYSIRFNAERYSSGVYFYKLKTNHYTRVRKMVFIR